MIITAERVTEIVYEQLKGKFLVDAIAELNIVPAHILVLLKPTIFLPDAEYWAAPLSDYKAILAKTLVDEEEYIEEKGDCDDFAVLLKAEFIKAAWYDGKRRRPYCFGEVWGQLPGPHAINWLIDDLETLYFIEPQSDEIFLPRENDQAIFLVKG